MNSFLNNLQVREKKLLLGALVLIFLFVIFVYINSIYDNYLISKKNLTKAKNDYEYVYKRVSTLKLYLDRTVLNEANINLMITANDLAGLISDLSIDKTNETVLVVFKAKDASSAITLSENIINKTELQINKILDTWLIRKAGAKLTWGTMGGIIGQDDLVISTGQNKNKYSDKIEVMTSMRNVDLASRATIAKSMLDLE